MTSPMKRTLLPALAGAGIATLILPAAALADSLDAANNGALPDSAVLNTLWVTISAVLVLFMLAGLMCLEAGMSRMKNVGTLVPKALVSMAVAGIAYYAAGFAFAFGNGDIIGSTGFLLIDYGDPQEAFGIMGLSDALIESKWLFQFAFCAVCLAIVWGSTLERIKFHAHAAFALVFAGFIYPLASHWVFGGGWLQTNIGMQDFAGSTAVHLVGATGALAGLIVLGARRGKYSSDGSPRPIPGHNMLVLGLGMFILLIGWFGFNAGSTLGVMDGRFAEVAMVTMLGASGGILGAYLATVVLQRKVDIGMVCNGLIAGLVAITAGSGYVENWAAPVIGLVGGLIVVPSILLIDRKLDDPVGVLSAHGIAGIWGRSPAACSPLRGSRSTRRSAIPTAASCTRARSPSSATRRSAWSSCSRWSSRSASAPGTRSRRRSGCASAPRPSWRASTSASTGCTATPSSSSPMPSSTAWPSPRSSATAAARRRRPGRRRPLRPDPLPRTAVGAACAGGAHPPGRSRRVIMARHVPMARGAGRALRPRVTGGGHGGDAARALRARRPARQPRAGPADLGARVRRSRSRRRAGRPRPVVYGRRAGAWLQYWMLYAHNSQDRGLLHTGRHEGDWEMVQFRLRRKRLVQAVYAQHSGAESCGYGFVRRAGIRRRYSSRAARTPRTSSPGCATARGPTRTTRPTVTACACGRG